MSIVLSILFAILLFSFLIFIHELGHFLTAKLSGVQVNEFSLFMGPAIFKKQKGQTLYAIRCIPIGGYCAMEGEDGDSDNPHSFGAAAWWKRLMILLAGAAMNFIAGMLLLAVLYAPAKGIVLPQIDSFTEQSLISGENGLQVGDRIVKIDGERVYIASDFSMLLSIHGGQSHDLVVERNGQLVELNDFAMPTYEEDGKRYYGFSWVVDTTFGRKVEAVWNTTMDYVRTVRLSFKMLLSGQAGFRDLSGPVGIVRQMSQTAEASESGLDAIMNLVNLGALIAINLAIMNLLPIPALDGGRAVCLLLTVAVEGITHKKLNPKYEAYLHGAGMVLLLIFMALITFKDVFAIFKR